MPATFIPDTMNGAELMADLLSTNSRRIRTGVVKGIPTGMTADSSVLDQALAAVLAVAPAGSSYPGQSYYIFSKLRVLPTISPTIARVELVYEPLNFGGSVPSTYVIRSRRYSMSGTTSVIPGTRRPLRLGFNDAGVKIPADTVKAPYRQPCRAVSVTAIVYGSTTLYQANGDHQGKVNADYWLGKKRGFWLLDQYETETSRYQGYTGIQMMAISKVVEDWSVAEILRDSRTGRYVNVPDAEIDAMNALDYFYGIMWPPANADGKGIMRAGLNDMIAFAPIFGFSTL